MLNKVFWALRYSRKERHHEHWEPYVWRMRLFIKTKRLYWPDFWMTSSHCHNDMIRIKVSFVYSVSRKDGFTSDFCVVEICCAKFPLKLAFMLYLPSWIAVTFFCILFLLNTFSVKRQKYLIIIRPNLIEE